MSLFIGIDCSFKNTVAVVLNTKLEMLGVYESRLSLPKYTPSKGFEFDFKWEASLHSDIEDFISGFRLQEVGNRINVIPCFIQLEAPSLASTGQLVQLSRLSYLLAYLLDPYGHVFELPPTSVKKFATNVGNAPKDKIMEQFKKDTNKEASSDDVADAYMLAKHIAYKHLLGLTSKDKPNELDTKKVNNLLSLEPKDTLDLVRARIDYIRKTL